MSKAQSDQKDRYSSAKNEPAAVSGAFSGVELAALRLEGKLSLTPFFLHFDTGAMVAAVCKALGAAGVKDDWIRIEVFIRR